MKTKAAPVHREELSSAEGTLWHIVTTKYIPNNLKIRTEATIYQYGCAFKDFRDYLRREPLLADLTDDNLVGMMRMMLDRGCAPRTVNERAGRIRAAWNWLARRRIVEQFPTVQNLRETKRTPKAWTREQLALLMEECDVQGGRIAGVPARLWWKALHLVLFDTGARIGEILALRWEWIDLATGYVDIPAEVRKGGEKDACYQLHAETLATLAAIHLPHGELVFAWEKTESMLYIRYKRILKAAGLPHDRKSKFHRMRKSVASHLQAGGHNASQALGHSSAEVTRESYLDPHVVGMVSPSAVLFRPGSRQQPVEVAAVAKPEPVLVAEDWL